MSRRDELLARRAALEAAFDDLVGKVDHSAAGRSFNYSATMRELRAAIAEIDRQIASEDGPWSIESVPL